MMIAFASVIAGILLTVAATIKRRAEFIDATKNLSMSPEMKGNAWERFVEDKEKRRPLTPHQKNSIKLSALALFVAICGFVKRAEIEERESRKESALVDLKKLKEFDPDAAELFEKLLNEKYIKGDAASCQAATKALDEYVNRTNALVSEIMSELPGKTRFRAIPEWGGDPNTGIYLKYCRDSIFTIYDMREKLSTIDKDGLALFNAVYKKAKEGEDIKSTPEYAAWSEHTQKTAAAIETLANHLGITFDKRIIKSGIYRELIDSPKTIMGPLFAKTWWLELTDTSIDNFSKLLAEVNAGRVNGHTARALIEKLQPSKVVGIAA